MRPDLSNPNTARKDVRADLNIALGNKEADRLHNRRTKQTDRQLFSVDIFSCDLSSASFQTLLK